MKRPPILTHRDGFTLIEIIAVLILFGILAVVAVPKFISLQEEAEFKSAEGVRSELIARANQYYAKYLLDNTSTENDQDLAAWSAEDVGSDFTLGNDGTNLTVTVASSSNIYTMSFTRGKSATDGTGYPASFGSPRP